MGWLYVLTFIKSHRLKRYSGITKNPFKNRYENHLRDARNFIDSCPLLCRAIRKYGEESIRVMVFHCEDKYLDEMEVIFIKLFNSLIPNGYNLTTGGQKGQVFSEYVREKMSEAHRKPNIFELRTYLTSYVKGEIMGFRILKPDCQQVIIADKTSPMEDKYKEALRVHSMTPSEIITYNMIRKAHTNTKRKLNAGDDYLLVTYLSYIPEPREGFAVRLKNQPSVYFIDKAKTKRQNYDEAIAYIANHM